MQLEFGLTRFPLTTERFILARVESLTSALVMSFLVIKAIFDMLPSYRAVLV